MNSNKNNTNPGTVAAAVANHDDEEMSCLTEPAYQPEAAAPEKAGDAEPDAEEEEPNEPDWGKIMQHEPARTEVPIFLSGRERKEAASDSYSTALDALHDSVNKSAESLVEIVVTLLHARAQKLVDIEGELTQDYVQNDKRRELMEKKLEENARAAQGMFANLLKRVSAANQPNDLLAQKKMRLNEDENEAMKNDCNGNPENEGGGDGNGNNEGQEPDWGKIMQHEPAQTEVPVFLTGRERREAACARFQSSIEDYHAIMDGYAQELTQTVADLYNTRMGKLDEHEQMLKQEYAVNDESRGKMLHNLQESSAAIQNKFQEMIMKVMLPNGGPQEQQEQSLEHGILTQAASLGESP
jgi:hypothetical protein